MQIIKNTTVVITSSKKTSILPVMSNKMLLLLFKKNIFKNTHDFSNLLTNVLNKLIFFCKTMKFFLLDALTRLS